MEHGVIERYEDNQLAVAIPDLAAVRGALRHCAAGVEEEDAVGVEVKDEDHDDRLGLALLTLKGVRDAAAKLRATDSELVERANQARRPESPARGAEPSDLDLVICWLRRHFASAYGGWVPTIGKNRVIEPVRGLPYIGGGGEGVPYLGGHGDPSADRSANGGTRAEAPRPSASPPVWPPRRANPGQGVRVGVLDTPLYPNAWLAGAYRAAPSDLLPAAGSSILPASAGHATFVAGLILRRAPGAELLIRPALDEQAVGRAWAVAKDMASFIGSGTDILNLSFGCYTDDGEPPLVLARAVSLLSAEILLVAAAGNHGDIDELRAEGKLADEPWTRGLTSKTPVWPAAFDEVIAVGATDGNELAAFSPRTPWVDLTAPGVNVESTYLRGKVKLAAPPGGSPTEGSPTVTFSNGFAYWAGTSFAAAAVSGAVAARILPGRCGAQQALAYICESPENGIRPFTEPGS